MPNIKEKILEIIKEAIDEKISVDAFESVSGLEAVVVGKDEAIAEIEQKLSDILRNNNQDLCNLLGKEVEVDYNLVEAYSKYNHIPENWDGKPFLTKVVGINPINRSGNGFGNNRGELNIHPDHNGNSKNIDVRMIKRIIK